MLYEFQKVKTVTYGSQNGCHGVFRGANVKAVVMEKPPVKGVDGLLGMSYLQRFIIRIDPANKRFVQQRIVAK
jgi:hypothetical protein